jgi:hypothetical protein
MIINMLLSWILEELQKEVYAKHGAKTEKQIEEEAAYKSLLDSLKL